MGISEETRGKTQARVLAGEATQPPVQCLRHWPESRSRGCKSGLSFLCGWRERGGVGEGGQKRAGIILLGRLQPMIVSVSQACAGRELACPNTERKVVLCADSGRVGDVLCLRPAPVREFVCA